MTDGARRIQRIYLVLTLLATLAAKIEEMMQGTMASPSSSSRL
mgnify:CR=1 FL=1